MFPQVAILGMVMFVVVVAAAAVVVAIVVVDAIDQQKEHDMRHGVFVADDLVLHTFPKLW